MTTKRYNVSSPHADEFISHEEILDTLQAAERAASDQALVAEILDRAALGRGLSHRDAAVLLECRTPELRERMYGIARSLKERIYGRRIVMFAPLYLSNYCVNGCVYCPYQLGNKQIPRKQLDQEAIRAEVIALQDMGHKRLALELGEHPTINTMDYLLESIETIYSIRHKRGAIRRVNVNIAATSVEHYRLLHEAGIGTYLLFQETYHRPTYEALHPSGPKRDYVYHTEAMDRAMQGGLDDLGLGVLFGLNTYKYDLVGLLLHAEHLEAVYGVGPHTVSVPRICPADGVDAGQFSHAIDDDTFAHIVAVLRLALPYAGMIVSTRESPASRERVLALGVSQLSGGSRTTVGGYSGLQEEAPGESSAQFDLSDRRPLDEIVAWLMRLGYVPSFCTACYRAGRTGDRFMALAKNGQIGNICAPNALMTLGEYLADYASPETRRLAAPLMAEELRHIPSQHTRRRTEDLLRAIQEGQRDFRF